MPPRRGPGPAHRARASGPRRGTRARTRVLLTTARRLAVAAFAVAAALYPQVALAHAQLLQSDPAPGAVLDAAPATVTLVFTEPVTPAGAGIRVYGPSGRETVRAVTVRGAALESALDAFEKGTYVVLWQVYSSDTHPSRGAFAFSVGGPSANPYASLLSTPEAGTSTPQGLALQALARWVHFAGFALTFGVVAYGVMAARREPFGRLVQAGAGLLIVAEPLSLVAQLASLSFDSDTALAVLGSGFGRILFLRLGAALIAWTLIATERSWPVIATGVAVAILDGLTAHAIPSVPGAGQALVSVHVAAMGLWAGGLVAFLRAPHQRFSRYAMITFGLAVVTGLVLALVHTRFGEALLSSDYGQVLLAKMAIVATAAIVALAGRRRIEVVAVFAAIAAAALVAALPPPL